MSIAMISTIALNPLRCVSPATWLVLAGAVSAIHHVDHVLRHDHSGWPFIPDVTTFTYSLAVYPIIALVLLLRFRPWLRAGIVFVLALAPTLAHTFVETPLDQYCTWARAPDVNLLGLSSPVLGIAAGAITVLLSILAFIAFLAFLDEAIASRKPVVVR